MASPNRPSASAADPRASSAKARIGRALADSATRSAAAARSTAPAGSPRSAWGVAEAAAGCDRQAEARGLLAPLAADAEVMPSPLLRSGVRVARALLAPEHEAEAAYQTALADPPPWPFTWGRLLLARGTWLRRQRRIADSRAPLRTARDVFDALGAAAWSERARHELRASGEASGPRLPSAVDALTAQELQVVRLAAEGLTNREVAERLYLSHRTVGAHLYRAFPKLGITTRAQLPDALG